MEFIQENIRIMHGNYHLLFSLARFSQSPSKQLSTREFYKRIFNAVVVKIVSAYLPSRWKKYVGGDDGHGLVKFCLRALSSSLVKMEDKLNGITVRKVILIDEAPPNLLTKQSAECPWHCISQRDGG